MILLSLALAAQAQPVRPEDTEQWTPVPPVVTPADLPPAPPPSDAVVLFDGRDLSGWVSAKDGSPARWTVADGAFAVAAGSGDIRTRASFGSYQLHIEWRVPADVTGEGQGRGNSGVYLAFVPDGGFGYELQILDSHGNDTYVNGMAGSLYKQAPPLVNATRPAGEWQSYDVVWTAPTFAADGAVTRQAAATVFLNGVLIQDHRALAGPTVYEGRPPYRPHGRAPILLQDHGTPVAFRNVWLRELP